MPLAPTASLATVSAAVADNTTTSFLTAVVGAVKVIVGALFPTTFTVIEEIEEVENVESETLEEKAPPGAKYERMVKHIKKGYSSDGELTKKEKGIAYATAWKAKKKGVKEETEKEPKHEDEKEDKSLIKKLVKKQMKKEDK